MAVYKERGRWRYRARVRRPDGRSERISGTADRRFNTKVACQRAEVDHIQRILSGQAQKIQEVPTLETFVKEFIRNYATTNNKPSEVETKEDILERHLLPAFGEKKLDEILQRHIEAYKADKLNLLSEDPADRLKPKTVNNHLSVLRTILMTAKEWAIIKTVPTVKWLKVEKPKFDFYEFDEADRLIAGANDEWRTMILVALRTGLRLGELLALRWEDVDLVRGQLTVHQNFVRGRIGTPKNNRSRTVPLSRQALEALKAHRHLRGESVFCDLDGKRFTKSLTKWPLWRACKRAGLRRIGWHVLRHTFASHLVMRGVSLKAVQELMGHSTIEMTLRYAHLSPGVKRDAVESLDSGQHLANAISTASNYV